MKEKIKCRNCDYYAEMKSSGTAFCRMQDKKIPLDCEKTRCKNYKVTDLCWKCKFFLPWIETSQGETNRVCVNEEKRTIKRCNQFNHPERCPEFKYTYE